MCENVQKVFQVFQECTIETAIESLQQVLGPKIASEREQSQGVPCFFNVC